MKIMCHNKIYITRYQRFGHVQRRETNALVGKNELIQVKGAKKGRGRPKIMLV